MITIGIIDDNPDQRDSFKDAIEIYLKKNKRDGVEILDREPLINKSDYLSWINEHDIAALIIDEKLADQPILATGKSCGYEGHEMAETLRKYASTIPIHVVTSASTNDDLKENRHLFENVLSRNDFLKEQNLWSEIFIRSGQRYYEEREKLFLRIAEISNLIVQKKASENDIKELRGLQEYFQIPLYNKEIMFREDLLNEFGNSLEELKKINIKAKNFLNNNELESN